MEPNLTPEAPSVAVPAALTRGYSNSWNNTMCTRRAEPPVLTQADLDALDRIRP